MPPPRRIFLKWCTLVRFGVYFDEISFLNFSKIIIFYKKINILVTQLLWQLKTCRISAEYERNNEEFLKTCYD